ncbi:hypothetical protein BGW38_002513 [Lunasporangiospora selenospora]|uniref:Protein Zds1 C-terminal domain-containing protein n=1 Tax=Lunasporangiospora selenospora TaxID=979761 RepID=A0A9P6KDG6_9FUNG|nr:hypothetical protein BGW38_002513 [Lunasporangiospora selenospora]
MPKAASSATASTTTTTINGIITVATAEATPQQSSPSLQHKSANGPDSSPVDSGFHSACVIAADLKRDTVQEKEIDPMQPTVVSVAPPSMDEPCTDPINTKKKTLSASSFSSTSSQSSSYSASSSSTLDIPVKEPILEANSFSEATAVPTTDLRIGTATEAETKAAPEATAEAEAEVPTQEQQTGSDQGISSTKDKRIEAPDPSSPLFWVPFHLHPEIAPQEYNKWLSRHGVDPVAGPSGLITSRGRAATRRKSVLSNQYDPNESDDAEPEEAENSNNSSNSNRTSTDSINDKRSSASSTEEPSLPQDTTGNPHDFLSGVFTVPLVEMGEPPLKMKPSAQRRGGSSGSFGIGENDSAQDVLIRDLKAARPLAGLSRSVPSLLRRSARTKVRRDSSVDLTGELPSLLLQHYQQVRDAKIPLQPVTLVDPGPRRRALSDPEEGTSDQEQTPEGTTPALPQSPPPASASSTSAPPTTVGQNGSATKPLRRFVSTLRDTSKPTITTYVEPELLEQQRKDMEEDSRMNLQPEQQGRPSSPTQPLPDQTGRQQQQWPQYTPTPSVPFPIPPSAQPSTNSPSTSTAAHTPQQQHHPNQQQSPHPQQQQPQQQKQKEHVPQSQEQKPQRPKQQQAKGASLKSSTPSTMPPAKKPSTWQRLWGKDKGASQKQQQNAQASPTVATTGPGQSEQNDVVPEAATKKSKTLSSLFSRNGKSGLGKSRSNSISNNWTGSGSNSKASKQETNDRSGGPNGKRVQVTVEHRPIGQEPLDPWRMPLQTERTIYRMSHVKLMHPRRPLLEQVLISNMMIWYLGIFNQEMQQIQQKQLQQMQQMQQDYPGEGQGVDGEEINQHYYSQDQQEASANQYDYYYAPEDYSADPRNGQDMNGREPLKNLVSKGLVNNEKLATKTSSGSLPPVAEGGETRHNARTVPDTEYDEESMIGSGFDPNTRWSDEDEDEPDEDVEEDSEDDDDNDDSDDVLIDRERRDSQQGRGNNDLDVVSDGNEGRSLYLKKNTNMDDLSHHLTNASLNSAETAPMPLTQHPAPRSSAKV